MAGLAHLYGFPHDGGISLVPGPSWSCFARDVSVDFRSIIPEGMRPVKDYRNSIV